MFRFIFPFILCLFFALASFAEDRTPFLETKARITALASGSDEWVKLKAKCDVSLDKIIEPNYAGWDWALYAMDYGLAYQVSLVRGAKADAEKYGKKALALAKVLARHHNLGADALMQYLGFGDGMTVQFTLPFVPASGSTLAVYLVPINETVMTRTSATDELGEGNYGVITKISNTPGGSADYAPADYRQHFRYTWMLNRLEWLGGHQPPFDAKYYVYMANGSPVAVASSGYTISGTRLTFRSAPASGYAVAVKAISGDYDQTGNNIGGVNSVQPDGPGYPMRTFNVGLAYVFDMIYDFPGFTDDLKKEFYDVLNEQVDWYGKYGYEHDGGGGVGNYFVRGYMTGTMYTAYGTSPANPRGEEFKILARNLIQITYDALDQKFSSGYAVQGQYWNGAIADIMAVFSKVRDITGEDLFSKLKWTDNLVPATIHSIKPDRKTGYDGGDWSNLPAGILSTVLQSFIQYFPNHPQTPFAVQALNDAGVAMPGTAADYKTVYPLAYQCAGTNPVYARSSWSADAVWMSLAISKYSLDHAHRDNGHLTIQRGSDDLLVDAGEYGDSASNPFHNTLLFDDTGALDWITYPPGQGWWGWSGNNVRRFSNIDASRMYAQVDFAAAYGRHYEGTPNSVTRARRSVLFIRPGIIIVHDQAQAVDPLVVKKFQMNFPENPKRDADVFFFTKGRSHLFMTSLVPADPSPMITMIDKKEHDSYNYIVTAPTGKLNDTFLHVFEATGLDQSSPARAGYIFNEDFQGVEIAGGGKQWIALFAKESENVGKSFAYSATGSGVQHHFLSDLKPGTGYRVTAKKADRTTVFERDMTADEQGIIEFELSTDQAVDIAMSAEDSGFAQPHQDPERIPE